LEYIAALFVPGLRRPWLIDSFFHGAGWFETFISNRRCQKLRPVNQHYFIFQILTEKKSLPSESLGCRNIGFVY
jgi:hypothetical protein